jgi:hypothetical protein
MEFVKRLTEHELTPSTELTAFSTLAEQAAQLIPVTLYCVIKIPLKFYYLFYRLILYSEVVFVNSLAPVR